MNKRLEFSENLKDWKTLAVWTEEASDKNWEKLQEWIYSAQPFGFFRMIDTDEKADTFDTEECVSG